MQKIVWAKNNYNSGSQIFQTIYEIRQVRNTATNYVTIHLLSERSEAERRRGTIIRSIYILLHLYLNAKAYILLSSY